MPHINELIDYTAEVFIVYEDKVLLRQHDKYKMWLSVGGHIELDEDPNQAAVREVKEEVGLDIELYHDESYKLREVKGYKELIPPQRLNIHDINETHKHISFVYFGRAQTDQLVLCEKEKSDGCKWFQRHELDDPQYNLKESVKEYAKAALDALVDN